MDLLTDVDVRDDAVILANALVDIALSFGLNSLDLPHDGTRF